MKQHFPRAALLLFSAYLLQWVLLFILATPAWDAAFYYAYSRSIIFDQDLQIANDLRLSYPTTAPDFAVRGLDEELTETGRVASPFALGSSLIWLPWLALLRLGAAVGQSFGLLPVTLSGYEWFFTGSVAMLSSLLGLMAFWLAYRLARAELSRFSSLAAALTLLFATPLLYYHFLEPLYSHATSAFITTIVVVLWYSCHKQLPGTGRALLLGALIGVAALVRWQHLVYLALPGVSILWWWLKLPAEERRRQWLPAVRTLIVVALAALALLSIQLIQWQLFYGSWLTIPQGGAYVDWRAPFWQPLLFSTYRGLLAWLPVLPLAVLGLLLLGRQRAQLVVPLLLVLLLESYVNSSTRDWFGGGGFGPRRYTSELAILLLGYAALLERLPARLRQALAVMAGLALAGHHWILLRYGIAERIGGRNLSMYPTYEWIDGSWADYGRQLWAHVPEIVNQPLTLFIYPGSPADLLLNQGRWPFEQLAVLLFSAAGLTLTWAFMRRLIQRPWPITDQRLAIILAGLSLLAFELWLLRLS